MVTSCASRLGQVVPPSGSEGIEWSNSFLGILCLLTTTEGVTDEYHMRLVRKRNTRLSV